MRLRIEANRREMMAAMLTAGVGALGTATFAADAGKLSDADYKKLASAPKNAADHRSLATYYRALAAEHETEGKALETLAAAYAKGLPGTATGQAHELSRAIRHAAEHSRDFAEAARDVAEVHEGIAQGPVK